MSTDFSSLAVSLPSTCSEGSLLPGGLFLPPSLSAALAQLAGQSVVLPRLQRHILPYVSRPGTPTDDDSCSCSTCGSSCCD